MTTIPSLGAPVPASQVDGWEEVYLSTKVEKTADAFEERIAELEKERDVLTTALATIHETSYDLRQQAKGAIDVTNSVMEKLALPECSDNKKEYFKAGIKAVVYGIEIEADDLKIKANELEQSE